MPSSEASEALRDVAESFSSASDTVARALNEIKTDLKQGRTMRRLLMVAIGLNLFVTIAAAVIIGITLNNNAGVHIIKDCTQTSGHCYQRQAQAQARVLQRTESAAVCAAREPKATLTEIQACVTKLAPSK